MKKIKSIILILSIMFAVSCMDMYNDVADEVGAEYNYYLAVANGSSQQKVSCISLDGEGNPSPVVQTATGITVNYNVVHPSGDFLYVVSTSTRTLLSYRILDDATLEQINSPITITTNGLEEPGRIKIDPSGKFLYILNPTADIGCYPKIYIYKINIDGSLISLGEELTGDDTLIQFAIDPSGNYIFVVFNDADESARIMKYEIKPDGTLLYKGSDNVYTNEYLSLDVKVHPNGKYIYVTASSDSEGAIFVYNYNLERIGTVQCGTGMGSYNSLVEIHPSGKYLYATSPVSYTIYDYKINTNGTLQPITTAGISLTTSGIIDSVIHPKDNYIFFSNSGGDRIIRVTINGDGSLAADDEYQWIGSTPLPYTGYTISATGLALIRKKK
jgi:6-phosphogluconolactonase (cycloisomerase 2 family)